MIDNDLPSFRRIPPDPWDARNAQTNVILVLKVKALLKRKRVFR